MALDPMQQAILQQLLATGSLQPGVLPPDVANAFTTAATGGGFAGVSTPPAFAFGAGGATASTAPTAMPSAAAMAMFAEQQAAAAAAAAAAGMSGGAGDAATAAEHQQRLAEAEALRLQTTTHSFMIAGTQFDIPARFQPTKVIGQGAYGIVISAQDVLTNTKVAIKKVANAFSNHTDIKRIFREIKLLRHFNHENLISIRDIFKPVSKAQFEDIYMVYELMDADLYSIINSNQGLSPEHVQYFVYQTLRGLKYLHSANVLHRDLKPSNLLVRKNCHLKIADFGLARVDDDVLMTEYVATRWYRAPEVVLSWKEYTKAIDVWSVGCIFGELLLRKPLFQGTDYINQIQRIVEIIGTPSEEDLAAVPNEQARQFVRGLGLKPRVSFAQLLGPAASPAAVDLVERMLHFNAAKRCTVAEALAHPYFEGLHDPNEEPSAPGVFRFDFEKLALNMNDYKELIWQEMLAYHPEAAQEELLLQQQAAAAAAAGGAAAPAAGGADGGAFSGASLLG